MSDRFVPPEILTLAHARATARREREWSEADRLRGEIEAAGWTIVDRGTDFALRPTHPPDVEVDGGVRYGSSGSVPSRLEDAPVGGASVVLVATDWPEDVARAVDALAQHSPDGTQVVVVDDAVPDDGVAMLEALEARAPGAPGVSIELVRLSARLGAAAALNAGIRRASAPVVVVMDASVEVTGDLVTPLTTALDDATVAVAGPFGIVSRDLREFQEPPDGTIDVDAIEGYAMAFRRTDYRERGPLDEHFAFYRNLDIWWSLMLRDGDWDDEGRETTPIRRAVRIPDAPVRRHEHRGWSSLPDAERDRLSKKNFYRLLKRFATRRDLLVANR
jgi:glycosyltransferase involved in cell wall biosynthesis